MEEVVENSVSAKRRRMLLPDCAADFLPCPCRHFLMSPCNTDIAVSLRLRVSQRQKELIIILSLSLAQPPLEWLNVAGVTVA